MPFRLAWSLIVVLLFALLAQNSSNTAQAHRSKTSPTQLDSLDQAPYIASRIGYNRRFSFINYYRNYIEWQDRSAISHYFEALRNANQEKARVLHIGDSHVQADIFTREIREGMEAVFGTGGRGFVFPYSAARTHAANDYKSSHSGYWKYARNVHANPSLPLGLTGATVKTYNPRASFSLRFRNGFLKAQNRKVTVFYKPSKQSFDLSLQSSRMPKGQNHQWEAGKDRDKPYLTATFSHQLGDTLNFQLEKNRKRQKFFECYGLLLENPEDRGVLYSSVGINGAQYASVLKQQLMPQQIQTYDPDLIVIDLGGNDFYPGRIREPHFSQRMRAIIDTVRAAAPEASILLTCAQDMQHRYRSLRACRKFSEKARKIAFEKGCAFYDYYQVSGGYGSMSKWYRNGLAQRDRLHLSHRGYEVKGELYLNAMLNSYHRYLALPKDSTQQLLVEQMQLKPDQTAKKALAKKEKQGPKKPTYSRPKTGFTTYRVRRGDNLVKISRHYGVSIDKIKAWNGLSSSTIYAGQRLRIYAKNAHQKQADKPSKPSPIQKHVVKKGDSLWSIARTYDTTVERIRRTNGLSNNNIDIGQRLTIK